MSYRLTIDGMGRLQALLGVTDKEVQRATRNALNTGATEIKRDMVNAINAGTGLKKKLVRARIQVRRAKNANAEARLASDSQGLPITEYIWRAEPTGHPTRARVVIRWFGVWKVAPGFVNPASQIPVPLKTRTPSGVLPRPVLAHGLSVAAAFKRVRDDGRLEKFTFRLAEIAEEKLADQIARRR